MVAWRYEISLLVLKKYFTRSLRSLVKYFSTLEEKFRISARPCNILYLSTFFSEKRKNKGSKAKEEILKSKSKSRSKVFKVCKVRKNC